MKKLFLVFCILAVAVMVDAKQIIYVQAPSGGGSGATDYTQLASCRGAWFMNGGTAGETDQSSYGANLTENGTIGTTTSVPTSYSGDARTFPGSTSDTLSQADGGSTDISGADQAITFCLWFNTSSFGSERTLAAKGRISDTEGWRLFLEETTQTLELTMSSDGTTTVKAAGATTLSTDTWYHGCFVYDDTDVRIYLNGSVDTNGGENPLTYSSGINDNTEPFYIGRSASQYFSGSVDEVIIFNEALTSTQIEEIYTSGIDGTKGAND